MKVTFKIFPPRSVDRLKRPLCATISILALIADSAPKLQRGEVWAAPRRSATLRRNTDQRYVYFPPDLYTYRIRDMPLPLRAGRHSWHSTRKPPPGASFSLYRVNLASRREKERERGGNMSRALRFDI